MIQLAGFGGGKQRVNLPDGKTLDIDIPEGTVDGQTLRLKGQGIGFDVPDLELSDVGRRRGGLTGSELAEVVANALQQRIAQKLLTNLDALRKGGVEGAIDALKGLLK